MMYPGALTFALPLFAAAAITGSLALYAFRRISRPGALTFGLLMAAMSEWAALYALELLAPALPGKWLAAQLQYLGITAVPPLWLAFALRFTGRAVWLTPGRLLLVTPGVLTFALVLTNEWHHLIWTGVGLDPDGAPAMYIAGHGAWFWVHTFISYAFILIGIALYAQNLVRTAYPYRQQAAAMLLGAIIPLAGNALYLSSLFPLPWLDPTPFFFTFSGVVLAVGFFRFGLLEIMPLAASLVVENLQDAVIVVDLFSRVVELNPAARRLFRVGSKAIGRNVLEVLWPMEVIRQYKEVAEEQMELEIDARLERHSDTLPRGHEAVSDGRCAFQLTVSPIRDDRGQLAGRLLVLRDVTRERTLLESEREQRQLAEALRQASLALSESLDLDTVLDRLLDQVRQVVPYDAANVMLVERSTAGGLGRVRISRMRGYEQFGEAVVRNIAALSFEIERTENLRRMVETGQPLIIPDTARYPGWIEVEASAHVRSWAGTPIVAHGQVVAFFSLDKVEPGFYRLVHAERLAAFAGQAAIAIENARLFAEAQRRAEEQRLLFEATRKFTAGLNEEDVLTAIACSMVEVLHVTRCTLSRWDQAQDCLVALRDCSGVDGCLKPARAVYPLADYPAIRRVLAARAPVIVRADDPAAEPAERALHKKYSDAAILMLPLVAGEHVFGLIELGRGVNSPPFSEDEIRLAQSLAGSAGVALENARLHAEVQTLAMTDSLTGLANRRAFDRTLEHEFKRARRYDHPLALLIADIDSFKQYNDTYGHPAGDERLKAIAKVLQNNVRDPDLAARYGGEEFAIILPHTDKKGAVVIAERIRAAAESAAPQCPDVAAPERSNAPIPGYTLSLGVATFPEDAQTAEELLRAADNAELAAKRAGKNCVCPAGQHPVRTATSSGKCRNPSNRPTSLRP